MESNRTWLSAVVFLDIVGYSKCSVARQIEMKDQMNEIIADSLDEVAEQDRVVVDAGDGAALCFLGDPEDALFSAVKIRDGFSQPGPMTPDYDVRIGINLGPVKVVRDINDRANVLGDGINVAQRVMAFAGENQIFVSRSFFEVISCLSQEYAELFHYRGVHKDKHVREHSVYEVNLPSEVQTVEPGTAPPVQTAPAAEPVIDTPPPAPAPVADTSSPARSTRSSEALSQIEHELAEFIGPLAKVLVKKADARHPHDDDFIAEIADAVTSDRDRIAFLGKLRRFGLRSHREDLDVPTGPVTGEPAAWSDDDLSKLESLLAEHVGPLAKVLVKKAARTAGSRSELNQLLAAEIENEEAQRRFLRAAS